MKYSPPPKLKAARKSGRIWKIGGWVLGGLAIAAFLIISLPKILVWKITYVQQQEFSALPDQFPVSVDPQNKTIVENAQVDQYLADVHSLEAAAIGSGSGFWNALDSLAAKIGNAPWYQAIAAAGERFVIINPGYRKEQAAAAFASALGWNAAEKKAFETPAKGADLPLAEGSYAPGAYFVSLGTAPQEAQGLVNARFASDVLAHYGTSTAAAVPLSQAITIASIIQRETIGTDGMRLISGIIWNRLFKGMNLQIDATLQYAKANHASSGEWWPAVKAGDTAIKSPYNTYLHAGLPPTAISNPSVAAILAALNPIRTDCLYYFNDKEGDFHCSATYAEHARLLKQYYGN